MLNRCFALTLVWLLAAGTLEGQQSPTFAFGAGTAPGEGGLHIGGRVEDTFQEGRRARRRLDVMVQEGESRQVIVMANLMSGGRPGPFSRYTIAGIGVHSGSYVPLAANIGYGVESTLLSSTPVFLEARLLYAADVVFSTRQGGGISRKDLFPMLTFGVKLPPRAR